MEKESNPKDEIKTTIEQFFSSMNHQDLDLMEHILAHDKAMVHIGTDSDEIWKGWDELRTATVEQFKGLQYYKAQIKDLQADQRYRGRKFALRHCPRDGQLF